MAEIHVSAIYQERIVEWLVERLRYPRHPFIPDDDPKPIDPAPPWLDEALDDRAFRTYLDASIALRAKDLQLEIDRLQIMKELIATLPGPLPHDS